MTRIKLRKKGRKKNDKLDTEQQQKTKKKNSLLTNQEKNGNSSQTKPKNEQSIQANEP